MGMFDGLVGGIVGAGMVSVVNGILEKHGGLQGVVGEFERNGFGATVKSWVGTGPNEPISPDQVHRYLARTCYSSAKRNQASPSRIWHRGFRKCCRKPWITSRLMAPSR